MATQTFKSNEIISNFIRRPAERTANHTVSQRYQDLVACALITALWVVTGWIVGLHGEFPLNDDWAYAKSVKTYVNSGELSREEWTHIPIVTHTLIGSAFVTVFGEHTGFFHALRLAGFFMAWCGIIGTYVLCRQIGGDSKWSTLSALLVGFNPIYFNLSFTFMTDVPFAALCVWSVALSVRGFVTGRFLWFVAGIYFAIMATLIRQFGLFLPLGFAAALVVTRPTRIRRWAMALALPLIVMFSYIIVTQFVYWNNQAIAGNAYLVHHVAIKIKQHLLFLLFENGTHHLLFLGFSLAPFGWIAFLSYRRHRPWIILLAFAITLLVTAVMLWKGWRLPGHNIIRNLGVGANETVPGFMSLPQTPHLAWWLISVLSAASTSCLVVVALDYFANNWPASRRNHIIIFLAGSIGVYMAIIVTRHFDRYILPVLPMTMAMLLYPLKAARGTGRAGAIGALILLLVFAMYSATGTYDYMERNRNRWSLLRALKDEDINSSKIHGGIEFNQWEGSGSDIKHKHVFSKELGVWLWVFEEDDEYVVSYAPKVEGYTLYAQNSYRRLLPPGNEQISVFRRNSNDATQADSNTDAAP